MPVDGEDLKKLQDMMERAGELDEKIEKLIKAETAETLKHPLWKPSGLRILFNVLLNAGMLLSGFLNKNFFVNLLRFLLIVVMSRYFRSSGVNLEQTQGNGR